MKIDDLTKYKISQLGVDLDDLENKIHERGMWLGFLVGLLIGIIFGHYL